MTKTEKNRIYERCSAWASAIEVLYLRKMALDGYCLNLDLRSYANGLSAPELQQQSELVRANECGKVYAADMEDLRQRLDELIDIGKQILSKLAEL